MLCPKKQSSSLACRGRKPGLVPSSSHSPSGPQLPGMLLAPPAWASAPEMATDPSPASPLTPTTTAAGGVSGPSHLPPSTEVTGSQHGAGMESLSPSLLTHICSPPLSLLGCYHSLLRKDSTQDSSRSDFRVCSAPLIKPPAAQQEDKQRPLSPINGPSAPALLRVWLWKGHVRRVQHAGTCVGFHLWRVEQKAWSRKVSCPHSMEPLGKADGVTPAWH